MMNYLLKFGNYVFPATLIPDGGPQDIDLGESELPRQDGSRLQPGRVKSRLLSVKGGVQADTMDALRAALDPLKSACVRGTAAPLFYGCDDRYFNAVVESFSDSYSEGQLWGALATISISFRCGEPFALGLVADTINFSMGQSSWTLDPSGDGDVRVLPLWTITVGAAGTGPLTLTNQTTQETATLTGPFAAGDVLTLNRDGYKVAQNGAPNFGLLSGRIPRLVSGVNAVSLTAGGTATVSAFSATYTPRWL